MNAFFKFVTDFFFSDRIGREALIRRSFLALIALFFIVFLLTFGAEPIIRWLSGEPQQEGAPLALPVSVLLLALSFLAATWKSHKMRTWAACLFLIFIGKVFEVFSRGASACARNKPIARFVAAVSLLLATLLIFDYFKHRELAKKFDERQALRRSEMYRFIERHPIDSRGERPAETLARSYCGLVSWDEVTGYLDQQDPCLKEFFHVLPVLYPLENTCLEGLHSPDEELPSRARHAIEEIERIGSVCTDTTARTYADLWIGKIRLLLGQQGRVLSETVAAHRALLKAKYHHSQPGSGAIANGLGNVMAHYIQNYDNLISGFCWKSPEEPPNPSHICESSSVSFVSAINTAMSYLRSGRDRESKKEQNFARARYENNVTDILFRLLSLSKKPYVRLSPEGNDPLSGIDASLKDEVDYLRKDPLAWIVDTRRRLSEHLGETDVTEVFVTLAQLGSIELSLKKHPEPTEEEPVVPTVSELHGIDAATLVSPMDALETAIFMGFRDKTFFKHPDYMGMCPLVLSESHGGRYLDLVEYFLGIPRETLLSDCRNV